ncbi:TIGR03086 family metal-binding protein [Streptomyces physcomitrii]|uniref:TIGR03086 family protein n=1 Tax=Streptomyces physcomitrii TaxID=2724184 RepID=A0ABX1H2G4_9ACTN|nr:TIGR03086 family metal-binding protein [Streptomyces physcomitrii]NKI41221.1 TIGR03086 family protein [Streptomyces physcomitrii]
MADILDLGPQTKEVLRLAEGVREEQFAQPTPCPDYTVRQLLGHLVELTGAFADAGRKNLGPGLDVSPDSRTPELREDWRTALPRLFAELAEAWREPAAYQGMTRAGGVDLPGEVAALVVADELLVHGWDLARATGQEYAPDPAALRAAHGFLAQAAEESERPPIFGPVVEVPAGAPLLDRTIGLSGREPEWSPRS